MVAPDPLGSAQARLLARLDRNNQAALVLPRDFDLLDSVTGARARSLALVERLSRSGWLVRVRRGAYVVRTRSATLRLTAVDLVGEISPRPHMITAGKALELSGLTDQ